MTLESWFGWFYDDKKHSKKHKKHHSSDGSDYDGHSDGYSTGYDGYSDYGHSGYDASSLGGHDVGYGHKEECCPLVVDLLCLITILAALAGATVLLGRVIQIEIVKGRRRKRDIFAEAADWEGKEEAS
jgi:hypothetical protein